MRVTDSSGELPACARGDHTLKRELASARPSVTFSEPTPMSAMLSFPDSPLMALFGNTRPVPFEAYFNYRRISVQVFRHLNARDLPDNAGR